MTTAQPLRIIVSYVGPDLFGLRMEAGTIKWDAELDMDAQQLLAIAQMCGHALFHEKQGFVIADGPAQILMPPEMGPAAAEALRLHIAHAIVAGFNKAAVE